MKANFLFLLLVLLCDDCFLILGEHAGFPTQQHMYVHFKKINTIVVQNSLALPYLLFFRSSCHRTHRKFTTYYYTCSTIFNQGIVNELNFPWYKSSICHGLIKCHLSKYSYNHTEFLQCIPHRGTCTLYTCRLHQVSS